MDVLKKINGIEIAINEQGQGPVLILVHGLSSSKEGMYHIRDMLCDRYRVISYDARGHGQSEMVPSYTLADHALDLIALSREYGRGGKVSLWGFSMGSYIACAALQREPDLFDKVILMGTKGDGKTSSVERILRERGLDPAKVGEVELAMILMKASFAPKTSMLRMLGLLKNRSKVRLTEEARRSEVEALHDFDLFPGMKDIKIPVLVLAGEYDAVNPPGLGKAVADAIPGARFVLVKGAGHMMSLEKKDFVGKVATEFLEG